MTGRWRCILVCVIAISMAIDGSRAASSKNKQTSGDDAEPGIIYLVGGIGGSGILGMSARLALPRAGVRHEIRNFVWTHGPGRLLSDLQDARHTRRKADELAAEILRIRHTNPQRPIYIVARSGGSGLALQAAERLPPGTLDRIVLLAAAVSPSYDLRPALRATSRQIVSFHSRRDQIALNWGTKTFGTIDRVYGPGAGLRGFTIPADLDEEGRWLYSRLVQVPWNSKMLWAGYTGSHSGSTFPTFLATEVAPWVR